MIDFPTARLRVDRRSVVQGLAALAACPRAARAQAAPLGGRLARGINLSHWFAQSDDGYGQKHLATFVTPDDLVRIADAGFSHVRLGLDPDPLFSMEGGRTRLVEPVLSSLRAALDRIAGLGLAVVIDLHPVGASKDPLLTPDGARTFLARWSALAGVLAKDARAGTFLEILNEPEPLKGEAWWDLQGKALAAIRAAGATHPVIANGGGWSGIDDLVARRPYEDPAVIYTVHHYAPILFTHQATTWSWDVARQVSGLGWPIPPERSVIAAAAATQDERARGFVRDQIAGGDFTQAAMDAQFDRLADWQESHGRQVSHGQNGAGRVPVYVGEFGVYAKAAPLEARLAWVRSAREAFEKRGWGWALWDNTPSFGFRSGPEQGRAIDGGMLRALGIGAS